MPSRGFKPRALSRMTKGATTSSLQSDTGKHRRTTATTRQWSFTITKSCSTRTTSSKSYTLGNWTKRSSRQSLSSSNRIFANKTNTKGEKCIESIRSLSSCKPVPSRTKRKRKGYNKNVWIWRKNGSFYKKPNSLTNCAIASSKPSKMN